MIKIALLGMMFGLFPVILIHELGHYLAACLLRVDVEALFIGIPIGKLRLTTSLFRGTRFVVGSLPVGGLCKFKNNPPTAEPWKMAIIMAAGPLVSIVSGVALMNLPLTSWFLQIVSIIHSIGIFEFFATYASFGSPVTRPELTGNFFGPLFFMKLVAWSVESGVATYFIIFGMINISVGITNLIPIPPLDGGQLLVSLGEWIFRRPVPESPKLVIWGVGALACIIFFGWVIVNDLIILADKA